MPAPVLFLQNGIKLYPAAARLLVFRLVVRVCEQKKNI